MLASAVSSNENMRQNVAQCRPNSERAKMHSWMENQVFLSESGEGGGGMFMFLHYSPKSPCENQQCLHLVKQNASPSKPQLILSIVVAGT